MPSVFALKIYKAWCGGEERWGGWEMGRLKCLCHTMMVVVVMGALDPEQGPMCSGICKIDRLRLRELIDKA